MAPLSWWPQLKLNESKELGGPVFAVFIGNDFGAAALVIHSSANVLAGRAWLGAW